MNEINDKPEGVMKQEERTGLNRSDETRVDDIERGMTHNSVTDWKTIQWSELKTEVELRQHRITSAAERGNERKVSNLQRMLVKSFAARALAVRQVSVLNKGKATAGVDNVLWTTPRQRLDAVKYLREEKAKKSSPLKRVYIPKSNGKMRPLGIPTMRDRAEQALWAMALLPVVEATSDKFSYGFRPKRGAHDAYAQIHACLARKDAAPWVLDADIKGFFDHLSHDWLLENVPMCKKTLGRWLKSGILESGNIDATMEGTPQGGVISPLLANCALNGLEDWIKKEFPAGRSNAISQEGKPYRARHKTQLNVVRYADDFIITGRSKRQLERVKESVKTFLAIRGLELSEEKTSIRQFDGEGFDFLGWHFRKYNGVFLGKVSRKSIQRHKAMLKEAIKNSGNMGPGDLIAKLNPIIRGWMNYHRVCANIWDVWGEMENWLFRQLWHWARKRHRSKGTIWVKARYWHKYEKSIWRFTGIDGKGKIVRMLRYDLRQNRIFRVPARVNVMSLNNQKLIEEITLRKTLQRLAVNGRRRTLVINQEGKCLDCNRMLDMSSSELHHKIIDKNDKTREHITNLVMLCKTCHKNRPEHKDARLKQPMKMAAGFND